MLDGTLHYGLLCALAIALVVAAVTDFKRREIDNWLTLAIALVAPLYWWASDLSLWPGVAIQLGMGVAAFAIGALLFALRQMGGGDVKLIAALGLWFQPQTLLVLLLAMVLLGWVLSLVMGTARIARANGNSPFRAEMLWMIATCLIASAFVSAFFGGPKIPVPAIDPNASYAWLVMMAPVIVVSIATLGAMRIIRRHDRKIQIPYGLAISTAGLWILGTQYLPLAGRAIGTG